jgi:hypothetical protein
VLKSGVTNSAELRILFKVLAVTAFQAVSIHSSGGKKKGTETRDTRGVPTDM